MIDRKNVQIRLIVRILCKHVYLHKHSHNLHGCGYCLKKGFSPVVRLSVHIGNGFMQSIGQIKQSSGCNFNGFF